MDPLLVSLLGAAEAAPQDVPLRLHLVELLRDRGEETEALRHCATALAVDPADPTARRFMQDLLVATGTPGSPGTDANDVTDGEPGPPSSSSGTAPDDPSGRAAPGLSAVQGGDRSSDVDDSWGERANVTLADVGGMDVAKERLEAAVLAPMRNPELRRLYRQSRSGGVLLYGPPGCGKTFLARATAGELDAPFLVLRFEGLPEHDAAAQIEAAFRAAREQAPAVLCLDAIEHLGGGGAPRRAPSSPGVAALVTELDKLVSGVTVMGSTNAPWDVDPALRRPGRLQQELLVLPPDRTTRELTVRQHAGEHPEVDVAEVARRSAGYSGRDLATAVRVAEHREMPVTTRGVLEALSEQAPSARTWLEHARRRLQAHPDTASFVGLRDYLAAVHEGDGA